MSAAADGASRVSLLVVDMQGNLRCKWVPAAQRDKLMSGQVRLPLSTQTQDVWGEDNDDLTGMGLSVGDPDALCIPEARTLLVEPWNTCSEQVLASLHENTDSPAFCDSRGVLATARNRLAERGLTAVAAVELEFYLLDASTRDTGIPQPPRQLQIAGAPKELQLYDPRSMDRVEDVLERIHRYADAMGIPAEATLAEFGPGQFEINLGHQHDVLKAADDAMLFKRLVDRAALDSGMLATFMAKPYTEHGGSGMHVHISLLDESRQNVFDAGDGEPTQLQAAASGLLDTLPEAQLLFAPHANSYRRLQPDSFAPVRMDWGYDHRGVAVRLPETRGSGARLEHRVSGADANPYLVLSALLNGILFGLDRGTPPDHPALMPGQEPGAASLSSDWASAIDNASQSTFLRDVLGSRLHDIYTRTKRHEAGKFNRQVSNIDLATYLPRV